MPLTIFDVKGVPATLRERIETAVTAGATASSGALRRPDHSRSVSLRREAAITGAHGFQREVLFAPDEKPTAITERVRATFEE